MDLEDEHTIDAVDECRFTAGGARAARSIIEAGGERDVLWAAVWVYASAPTDPVALRPLTAGGVDPSIRVTAAAVLTSLGDRPGLDGLLASLSAEGMLVGAKPPRSVAQFAMYTARRYVTWPGAPSAPTDLDGIPQVAEAWASWLRTNLDALRFDAKSATWVLP